MSIDTHDEYDQLFADLKREEAIRTAVKTIVDELNGGSAKKVSSWILEELRHTHRTLQQSFWDALLATQIGYADFDHDLRNEQAVLLAQAVRVLARTHNWDRGLPHY